jgi:hypothetical protein
MRLPPHTPFGCRAAAEGMLQAPYAAMDIANIVWGTLAGTKKPCPALAVDAAQAGLKAYTAHIGTPPAGGACSSASSRRRVRLSGSNEAGIKDAGFAGRARGVSVAGVSAVSSGALADADWEGGARPDLLEHVLAVNMWNGMGMPTASPSAFAAGTQKPGGKPKLLHASNVGMQVGGIVGTALPVGPGTVVGSSGGKPEGDFRRACGSFLKASRVGVAVPVEGVVAGATFAVIAGSVKGAAECTATGD